MTKKIKHVGIRPSYPLVTDDIEKYNVFKRYRSEVLPDGSERRWTKRMLKSGCGQIVDGERKIGDLIYCEHCQEYFAKEQFENA